VLKQTDDGNEWVVPEQMIPGDLVVEGTITADKLEANSIGTFQLKVYGEGAITASDIGAATQDDLTTSLAAITPESLGAIPDTLYTPSTTTIDGANITTNTIAATTIEAYSLTAAQIAADAITSNEIDVATLNVEDQNLTGNLNVDGANGSFAWNKTSAADTDTTGIWFGNAAGTPYFSFGDADSYISYINGSLFVIGALFSGSAAEGTATSFTQTNYNNRYNIPPTAAEVEIDLIGGGGGGHGVILCLTNNGKYYGGCLRTGSSGGQTTATVYDSNDNALAYFYSDGGSQTGSESCNTSQGYNSYCGLSYQGCGCTDQGDAVDFDAKGFVGTGGNGSNVAYYPTGGYPYASAGTGTSGEINSQLLGMCTDHPVSDTGTVLDTQSLCEAEGYTWDATASGENGTFKYTVENPGEYIIFNIGLGGAGGAGGGTYSEGGGSKDTQLRYAAGGSGAQGAALVTVSIG